MPAAPAKTCPLCRARKARRACPALEQTICAVCCATKREVEIRCPPSCSYLSSARSHPPAVIQRRQEQDLRFFLPLVSDLTEGQFRVLLFLQAVVVRHASGAMPPLLDLEVAEAAGALAATLETAGKGIIYEHHATSMPAERLVAEFRRALEELLADAGAAQRSLERDAALAARRLEQGAKTAAKALPEDEPPVYLRLVDRLMSRRELNPAPDDALDSSSSPSPGRLIIPG